MFGNKKIIKKLDDIENAVKYDLDLTVQLEDKEKMIKSISVENQELKRKIEIYERYYDSDSDVTEEIKEKVKNELNISNEIKNLEMQCAILRSQLSTMQRFLSITWAYNPIAPWYLH